MVEAEFSRLLADEERAKKALENKKRLEVLKEESDHDVHA